MTSIRQIPIAHSPRSLPDWRNFGVVLRVLLGVNGLALLAALTAAEDWARWPDRYVEAAAWVEPPLLLLLGLLALARDRLGRLPERAAQAAVVVLAGLLAALQHELGARLGLAAPSFFAFARAGFLGAAAAVLLLAYFDLRLRAFSPAVAEARMAALNARIRPHFLFNSLNTVLALIRAQPKLAEAALETLSDLFRTALRDHKELVPLADEIALGRQYFDLEKLRLGERLQVEWLFDAVPPDTPIPPLMLQPLLENAVYHGIERSPEGGTVRIHFSRRGDELLIEIANPLASGGQHGAGNQMAVANIRERLALYYDLEARLEISTTADTYLVRIVLPCPTRNPPRSES